jgi:hypothetical protein
VYVMNYVLKFCFLIVSQLIKINYLLKPQIMESLRTLPLVTTKTTKDNIKYNTHDLLFYYNKILQQILQNTKYNFVQ